MTAHEIIIRPIVSERSFSGMELNKYTFEVAKDANKYQIKDAVEEIFGRQGRSREHPDGQAQDQARALMSPQDPFLEEGHRHAGLRATPSRSLATRPKTRCC